MNPDFQNVFEQLRAILRKHAGVLGVQEDTATCYCLGGAPGPSTLKAWGGKAKTSAIPVAWVKVGKAYVGYHLMGVYCNPKLLEDVSKSLRARMQGKSCFNFSAADEALFQELESLTAKSIAMFSRAGYVSAT